MLNASDAPTGSSRRAKEAESAAEVPHRREMERQGSRYDERFESGYVRHWDAVLRGVREQSKVSSHHCSACAERVGASPVVRSLFGCVLKGEPKLLNLQER
jgi:hypothetical protein